MSLLTTLLANAEALALLATAAAVATADGASILGASLFGSLCVAAIRPTYGDASDVYATVGVIVCAVGALSGGAVAALAPQKVTAVSAATGLRNRPDQACTWPTRCRRGASHLPAMPA